MKKDPNSAKPPRRPRKERSTPNKLEQFWKKFNKKFPTEKDAQNEIFRRCLKAKKTCCRKRKLDIKDGERAAKCKTCKVQTWFTSGTFFEGIENCRAWLAGVLIFEQKIETSACAFSKRIGCSSSTGQDIFHKLRIVVAREIEDNALKVPSDAFKRAINKRSRQTPIDQHPMTEIDEARKQSEQNKESPTAEDKINQLLESLSPDAQRTYYALSETPVHIDKLSQQLNIPIGGMTAILVELEIYGLVKHISGRYARSNSSPQVRNAAPAPAQAQTQAQAPAPAPRTSKPQQSVPKDDRFKSIVQIVDYLRARYHGLSRKYLQLYIASVWALSAPTRWARGALFRLCVYSDRITREDILAYKSEWQIAIPFFPCANSEAS